MFVLSRLLLAEKGGKKRGLKDSPTIIFSFSCWTLLLLRAINEELLSDKSFKLLGCSAPPDPVSVSMFRKLQLLWTAKTHLCWSSEGEAVCLFLLEVLPRLPRSWEGRRSEGL